MGRARERTKRERRTARAFDDSWPPFEKLNISGATRAIRILPCAHTSRLPPAVEHGRTPCRVYGSRGRYFSVHEHDCLCRKGGRRRRRKEEEETLGGRAPTLGLNLARQNLVLCATCCIISVLTQWGATLVINLKGGNERTHNGGHNSQHTVTPRRGEHVHVGQRKYVRLYDGNEWKLYIYCTLQARQSAHKLDAPPLQVTSTRARGCTARAGRRSSAPG